jgi:iron complex transport system ATP-binding protein
MLVMSSREQPAGAALAFEDVTFGYRGTPVVEGVRLRLQPGELVALLGPNGAGKSTLLRLATGILRPNQGRIRLQGRDVRELARPEIARRVAVVPQEFSLQFAYTVRQLVVLGRLPHTGVWRVARAADREAVRAALAATQTEALADRVFQELSGGERQRVLLALALAQEASILLLDEPTAHLDIKHQVEVLELLRRLHLERGMTVLAVLHDLNLAARYFPRLVLLDRGVLADGPPAEVLDSALISRVYQTPVQVGILRGGQYLSVLPDGRGADEAPVVGEAPSGTRPPAVHVIAGGGSGELVMRALADAGIPFTAGPLNAGDSDHALAQRLGMLCITEPPFAAVSPQGLASAYEHMTSARAVIVCPVPLGHGNVKLLARAAEARRAGVPVVLLEPGWSGGLANGTEVSQLTVPDSVLARDFSGQARERYAELLAAGARWATSVGEAVELVEGSLSYSQCLSDLGGASEPRAECR